MKQDANRRGEFTPEPRERKPGDPIGPPDLRWPGVTANPITSLGEQGVLADPGTVLGYD